MKKALRSLNATLGIAILVSVFTPVANAECGYLNKFRPTASMWQEQSWSRQFGRASLLLVSEEPGIVGFWRVKLVSENTPGIPDGTVIDAGFLQFHSDGTEILNSSRPPATGSFCLGVWKRNGPSRYEINHFAISWDPNGNLVGPANIREELTLSHDHDSFAGSFTLNQYDQGGNLLVHIVGKVEGKRITVDTSITDVL